MNTLRHLTVSALAGAALLAAAGAAQAKDGFYLAPSAGLLFAESEKLSDPGFTAELDYDTGWAISGAVGYRMGQFRLEGELGYGQINGANLTLNGTDYDVDADLDIFTGTLGGFYDIATGGPVSPYLGGGIGFANTDVGSVSVGGQSLDGGSDTDLLLFGEAGLNWQVSETVALVPSYRYSWVDGAGGDNGKVHALRLGLRIGF